MTNSTCYATKLTSQRSLEKALKLTSSLFTRQNIFHKAVSNRLSYKLTKLVVLEATSTNPRSFQTFCSRWCGVACTSSFPVLYSFKAVTGSKGLDSKIITGEYRAPFSRSGDSWLVRGALISKRAEVTLPDSSGPLSFIANRVSSCRRHAKHPSHDHIHDGEPAVVINLLLLHWSCPSKWLLSAGVLCSPKSCLINGVIKCWSRFMQSFDLTWCSSC